MSAVCPICQKPGHAPDKCPELPANLGKREFNKEEEEKARQEMDHVKAGFFDKLKNVMSKVPFVRDAVAMYFCMLDPKTPFWVKASVASALAYFIMPIDAIPDPIPIVGYADDAAVIYLVLSIVHRHILDEHIRQADEWLSGSASGEAGDTVSAS